MFKGYILIGVLAFVFVGCTGKDTIPPMPPKHTKADIEEIRTMDELQSKLERIRNPIEGENVRVQKKDARREVDTLLRDTKRYKGKVSRFEKAQFLAYKKAKKSYVRKHKAKKRGRKSKKQKVEKKEAIYKVNKHENKLKYY